jgi:Zn-dependent protease
MIGCKKLRIQQIFRNLKYLKNIRFTRKEIMRLVISMLIIAFCFSFRYLNNLAYYQTAFGITLLTVGLGFILHELGHKFSAQTWGFYSEFKWSKFGLLFTVVSAIATMGTIVFAAPGAVVMDIPYDRQIELQDPRLRKKVLMEIIYAGPLVNIALAIIFGIIGAISTMQVSIIGFQIGIRGFSINSWLAFFNLLPVSLGLPLDGKQMYEIDRKKWLYFFLLAIVLVISSFALMFYI